MHDYRDERQHDSEVVRPPALGSATPALPVDREADSDDPGHGQQSQKPGLDPEVEDDVVRVDEIRQRVEVAEERNDPFREAREAGAEDRPFAQKVDGGGPQVEAALDRVSVNVLRLDQDARPDRWHEGQNREPQQGEAQQRDPAAVREH